MHGVAWNPRIPVPSLPAALKILNLVVESTDRACHFMCCVILGKLLNLSVPQIPHL